MSADRNQITIRKENAYEFSVKDDSDGIDGDKYYYPYSMLSDFLCDNSDLTLEQAQMLTSEFTNTEVNEIVIQTVISVTVKMVKATDGLDSVTH